MRPTPQLSVKTCGGGVGGRAGGGYWQLSRGEGLCTTHYYHMHTSRVCVCLGPWGYRGMYALIATSRLCQEESLRGLKDQRHSTPLPLSMGQKIWRRWRHGPHTAIFQNSGGGRVAYKDRARPPPVEGALSSNDTPPPPAPVSKVLKKNGPNKSVRWTRRSVPPHPRISYAKSQVITVPTPTITWTMSSTRRFKKRRLPGGLAQERGI